MKAATIIIAIILLLPTSQQSSAGMERKVLSYNPTYEFWFFMPTGRPDDVPQTVKDVYWKTKSVCYTDFWFHCESGKAIV
ncbi:uncharacterized protein [Drosophila kikkawai]|uniref:Uncharacterized protein n=1 Tax=Drosophila kikkawai TaxID=30033 RepID=A0A6P4I9C3_DROKI|nr:uncharacterized protein LOC108076401 [Drosophila kikkawai]